MPLDERQPVERFLFIIHLYSEMQAGFVVDVANEIVGQATSDSAPLIMNYLTDFVEFEWTADLIFARPTNDIKGGIVYRLKGRSVVNICFDSVILDDGEEIMRSDVAA